MRSAVLIPCLALVACTDPQPMAADARADLGVDATANDVPLGDVPLADVTVVTVDAPPPRVPPLAPERAPTPLTSVSWVTARIIGGGDVVLDQMERRTFTIPAAGTRDGLAWSAVTTDARGEIGNVPANNTLWAATRVDLLAGRFLFARVDRASAVYSDFAPQPADIYGSGRTRVPLVRGADGAVVVRGFGGRGPVVAQLFSTEDELHLNLDDVTLPDLVAGESRAQWVGVPVLNLTNNPALDVTARVEESDAFEGTAVRVPAIPAGAVTQVTFALRPKRPYPAAMERLRVGLRVESPSMQWSYRREVELSAVAAGATHRRTFVSRMDGSTQYYGVVPPANFDPSRAYAMVLSLHGASVEGIGQARAYSAKDWAYIVAPTNRRPFGFDWEVFGRVDGIEVLDDAIAQAHIDPERVYLTGHSMGGHGTWQLGVLFPGRFATVGPSAGWNSFQSYTGRAAPRGAFARSQASSTSSAYLSNLARRGVYVIHGSADDNVPVREGRTMSMLARMATPDVTYHEEPGAGHWWDGDRSPGADCVDWPPLFAFMQSHRLDPSETDFTFTTPSPWVNPRHAFVTVLSSASADEDVSVTSAREGSAVVITTRNARALRIDGAALRARGITSIRVDGTAREVPMEPFTVGPTTGKTLGVHGPFNQSIERLWCVVYPDDGPRAYREYASYLLSNWSIIGNGAGCAVPRSRVDAALRRERNLLWLGVDRASASVPASVPFTQSDTAVGDGANQWDAAAVVTVFPAGEHLDAWISATPGSEFLLFRVQPFTSGFVLPDYFVWDESGGRAAGFYAPDWSYRE